MRPRRTLATSARVLSQLGHDPRTLALMFVMPLVLLGLLKWLYSATPATYDKIAPALLCLFPFTIMFLTTSVTMLRERTSGTLERLLTMPMGKLDLIFGYAISFGWLAMLQATVASLVVTRVYGLNIAGPEWFLVVIAVADALLGTMLGLLASAFARTEFQASQFMPTFILPQVLLCGLLVPVALLPGPLEAIANVLPLTYAIDAMTHITKETALSGEVYKNLIVVLGFALAAVLLGAATLKRRVK